MIRRRLVEFGLIALVLQIGSVAGEYAELTIFVDVVSGLLRGFAGNAEECNLTFDFELSMIFAVF